MVSTSALTWARARTSASRAGESSSPSFAVRVRGGTVGVSRPAGPRRVYARHRGESKNGASVRLLPRTRLPAETGAARRALRRPGLEVTMVRKPVVLITGASGEIGHGLIERLSRDGRRPIVTLDLKRPRARPGRARPAAVRGLDPRRQPARAHPVGVRGGPRVPPRGAPLHAGRVHARRPRTRSTSRARCGCWSSRRRRASRTGGPSSSCTRARSRPTGCRTSRRRRGWGG